MRQPLAPDNSHFPKQDLPAPGIAGIMAGHGTGDWQACGWGKIVVVIPAYNEERFIGSVVLKARKYTGLVVVVDDGSVDGTAEMAEAAGAIVARHAQNRGKGIALNTGFQKARELAPDAVVTIDGDAQHLPEEMGTVLAPILSGAADIVVGSRYLQVAHQTPRHRVMGHWLMTHFTNFSSGVPLTDSQSGFRAFSPKALQEISFNSGGFSVESEMQFLAREYGLVMKEVPITIRYEDKPKRSVIAHGLAVLNGVLQIIGQHRPLLFFGFPGLVLLIVGLLWSLLVVDIYRTSQMLAIGYALISVLLLVTGALSLFTGIILHSMRGMILGLVRTDHQKVHI